MFLLDKQHLILFQWVILPIKFQTEGETMKTKPLVYYCETEEIVG